MRIKLNNIYKRLAKFLAHGKPSKISAENVYTFIYCIYICTNFIVKDIQIQSILLTKK